MTVAEFAAHHGNSVANAYKAKVLGTAPVQVASNKKKSKKQAEPKVAANSVQNVSVMQKSNEPNLAVISKNKPPTAPSVANVKSIKSPENIPNAKPTSEQKIVASQNFISPDNVGQNLSDSRMAHIATGGIGGSFVA